MSVVNQPTLFLQKASRRHDQIQKDPGRRSDHRRHLLLLMLICLLPMLHVLACSLSSADALVKNEVFLWPEGLEY